MPLDTLPLSPARRALLALLLIALLLASLGLAGWLVLVRGSPTVSLPSRGVLLVKTPPGFAVNLPQYANQPGLAFACTDPNLQPPRNLLAFSYRLDADDSPPLNAEARRLLANLAPQGGTDVLRTAPAVLAGRQALDLFPAAQVSPQEVFWLIRITNIEGKIVAICFSGQGPVTDSDMDFLNLFCRDNVAADDPFPNP